MGKTTLETLKMSVVLVKTA